MIGAAGGVIVTASHNPSQWNALKFLEKGGLFLDVDGFNRLMSEKDEPTQWARFDRIGGYSIASEAARIHVDKVLWLGWLEAATVRDAKLRVVVDANGGTGAITLLPLLEKLGCETIPIACEPDGDFRHEPEPIPANLSALERAVLEHSADIGLATDPDADRLALVDANGRAIGEEFTLAIGAAEVINFVPGPIVVNLSTSAMVESIGQRVERTPVGEINVSRRMLDIGSPVGGEGNGGLIVPACHPGRDATLAAAVVLHRMARTGKSLSQLAAEFPHLYMVKTKVETTFSVEDNIDRLTEEFSPESIDTTDGVRITTADGWVHVRASNTEPVIRIIAESSSKSKAEKLVRKAISVLA
jgi:phosphomannomutase